jgi:hypothetical protein
MEQVARNATMEGTGYLNSCRYLLHDRDAKFCSEFHGNASRSCWAGHSAVGWAVTTKMDDPAFVGQDQEHAYDLKPDSRHRQEVDGHHSFDVIFGEGPPGLRRRLPLSDHTLPDLVSLTLMPSLSSSPWMRALCSAGK